VVELEEVIHQIQEQEVLEALTLVVVDQVVDHLLYQQAEQAVQESWSLEQMQVKELHYQQHQVDQFLIYVRVEV